MAKKIIFALSVFLNAAFLLLLLLLVSLGRGTSSFSFVDHGAGYHSSALVVSAPAGSGVGFGPVEISMEAGESAYLQFSAHIGGRQSSLAMEPLYDHGVVSVGQSGFGIVITGIGPGDATLQLFSPQGFKDIAYVTVH